MLQGDTLASCLFIICTSDVDRYNEQNGFSLEKAESRRWPAQTITDTYYVDDIALLANTPVQVEFLLYCLERSAGGITLHVKADNAEYMYCN